MRSQLQEIEFKLKKVRNKAKEDEKKFAEVHESVVSTEERCRNMNEIVKFKQSEQAKSGVKEIVTKEDLAELETQYEAYIFEKEENQIQ